jgi:hypothetical protein
VGIFAADRGAPRCESVTARPLRSVAEENWPAAIVEVLAKLSSAVPRGCPVVLVLPTHAVQLKQMRTPRLPAAKNRQVLAFAVAQAWPQVAGELVWDAISAADAGEEMDHLVVAARLPVLAPLCDAIAAAGRELVTVVPSILTLRRAEDQATAAPRRLVIEVGVRTMTFLQIDGERFAVRAVTSVAPDSGDSVQRLAQEATRTLLHFNRQNGFANPELVELASEENWESDRLSRLAELVKLPVTRLGATAAPALANIPGTAAGIAGVRLLGAAAIGLSRQDFPLQLLPPVMREQQRRRRIRPWLAASAVLAAAALLPPIFLLRDEAVTMRRQLADKEAFLAPVLAQSDRMRMAQREIARLGLEAGKIEELARHRTAWLELLAGLQARFSVVQDVWLDRLQVVTAAGEGSVKLVVGGYLLDRGGEPVAGRMKNLVRELRTLPSVAAVEGERFDASRPHLLRFELVLVMAAAHPL